MSFKREVGEHAKFSLAWLWYSVLVVAILIGATVAVLYFKPTFMHLERKAIKTSHQYIEGKQSMLLKLAEEYNTAGVQLAQYQAAQKDGKNFSEVIKQLGDQRSVLLSRIKEEAQRLPVNEIPPAVNQAINQSNESNEWRNLQ